MLVPPSSSFRPSESPSCFISHVTLAHIFACVLPHINYVSASSSTFANISSNKILVSNYYCPRGAVIFNVIMKPQLVLFSIIQKLMSNEIARATFSNSSCIVGETARIIVNFLTFNYRSSIHNLYVFYINYTRR